MVIDSINDGIVIDHIRAGLGMEQKAFSVGLRVEHPQRMIDLSQYGRDRGNILPPAAYKLTHQLDSGRGVYSFCMRAMRSSRPTSVQNS